MAILDMTMINLEKRIRLSDMIKYSHMFERISSMTFHHEKILNLLDVLRSLATIISWQVVLSEFSVRRMPETRVLM